MQRNRDQHKLITSIIGVVGLRLFSVGCSARYCLPFVLIDQIECILWIPTLKEQALTMKCNHLGKWEWCNWSHACTRWACLYFIILTAWAHQIAGSWLHWKNDSDLDQEFIMYSSMIRNVEQIIWTPIIETSSFSFFLFFSLLVFLGGFFFFFAVLLFIKTHLRKVVK